MKEELEKTAGKSLNSSSRNLTEESSCGSLDILTEGFVEGFFEESDRSICQEFEEVSEEIKDEIIEETGKKSRKKICIAIAIFSITFYSIMSFYFMDHFYFGSKINDISVSGRSLEGAQKKVASELQSFSITLVERFGKTEEITGSDIRLRYKSTEDFLKLKERQNPFLWFLAPFKGEDYKVKVEVEYDEKKLLKRIDSLECFELSNIIEPENASFSCFGQSYLIRSEISGNKVNKKILSSKIARAILNGKTRLDLEDSNCYVKPRYTYSSPKVVKVNNMLNEYISSEIIYNFGENKEVADELMISKWITVDKNYIVSIDEEKIKKWLKDLAKKYNTVGKMRNFAASTGETVLIGGGDYGWIMDVAQETENLVADIKSGQKITKEPAYRQTAAEQGVNDIGDTYVEINIDQQHLWFYKDGLLLVEGPIVTGNVSKGMQTPKGIFCLKYKQKDAILRGPDYEAPVTYWMPFNGGIGLHDATWRSRFGGRIFKTNGSHGCINLPYSVAKTIFNNIEVNTPIIVY